MPSDSSSDYVASIEELLVQRDAVLARLFARPDGSMRLALQEVCRALASAVQEPGNLCESEIEVLCRAVDVLSRSIVRFESHEHAISHDFPIGQCPNITGRLPGEGDDAT